jgi:hypothetical protein
MDQEHMRKKAGPFVLALMSPALSAFVAIGLVGQFLMAPRYGQGTANVFMWNAFLVVGVMWVLEAVKQAVLARLGYSPEKQ